METVETEIVSQVSDGLDPKVERHLREKARERFLRFGFSKVTMEEIAEDAGVSKKTLYRYFPGKEELLRAVARELIQETAANIHACLADDGLPFRERMRRLATSIGLRMRTIDPAVREDLRRNASAVWDELEDFRKQTITATVDRVVREGMRRGMLRHDIPPDFVVALYMGAAQNAFVPEQLARMALTHHEAFDFVIKVFFEGLLTDRARSPHRRAGHKRKVKST
jgi:AcrR family transcriptional regulator